MAQTTQGDKLPAVMTVEEAAAYLRIGRSSAYEAVRCGTIPSVKIGKQYRIPRRGLLDWLEQQDEAAQAGEHGAATVKREESGHVGRPISLR